MKRTRLLSIIGGSLLIVMAFSVNQSHAKFFGQVSTARTLVRGANDVGGYIGIFDGFTTLFGQYRRGLSTNMDFGLQAGLIDPDARGSDAGLILGGDLKWNVMSAGYDPLDMALGARGSFYDISNVSVFALGASVIISRDYAIEGGGILAPYGSVNVRLEHESYDAVDAFDPPRLRSAALADDEFDDDDTDIEIGGTAGVKWELSDFVDALGEVVLDEDWGLVLGLNFKL
ncbi:MAG: hypothetical protein GF341_01770 [candidate division Zixibacteria bacterium]|nr:hypothetical protein [candidate division Zixibacteria bacterium]